MTRRSSRAGLKALDAMLWPLRRLRLAPTRVAPDRVPLRDDLPVLLIANHVSWWDGFLLREVHERLRPRDPFAVVMTERELARRPWLESLGAIGIQRGSFSGLRDLVRELDARRQSDPRTVFAFFPQGRIWPSSRRPLGFRRGIRLVARTLAPVSVIPVGIHIEPLNGPTPTPFVSLGAPRVFHPGDPLDVDLLESTVEREIDTVIDFLGLHGERAVDRWPGYEESDTHLAVNP